MSTVTDLRGRNFLTLAEFSADELTYLLDLAADLKAAKRQHREEKHLTGKQIALIFEKDSTRTRCAFEVAAHDQGAHVTYLGPGGSHMGHKETVKDTARVLGRMYDAIEYRGFGEAVADELAAWAGVPVYNGLTDEWHPTQILADFLTLREHIDKPLADVSFCYLGDARFNMADSYLVGGAKLGMDIRIASPRRSGRISRSSTSRTRWQRSPAPRSRSPRASRTPFAAATRSPRTSGCRWASPRIAWAERIRLLLPYQVNAGVLALTGNPDVKFLHCLPAFHNADTAVGATSRPGSASTRWRSPTRSSNRRISRLRRSREPAAHDQGRARRDARPLDLAFHPATTGDTHENHRGCHRRLRGAGAALELAAQIAGETGAELCCVSVDDSLDTTGIDPAPEQRARAGAQLARESGLQAEAVAKVGPAVERIIEVADERDAGLIVVGSRGHGAIVGTDLGSVSMGLVRKSRRPVLVVKSSDV